MMIPPGFQQDRILHPLSDTSLLPCSGRTAYIFAPTPVLGAFIKVYTEHPHPPDPVVTVLYQAPYRDVFPRLSELMRAVPPLRPRDPSFPVRQPSRSCERTAMHLREPRQPKITLSLERVSFLAASAFWNSLLHDPTSAGAGRREAAERQHPPDSHRLLWKCALGTRRHTRDADRAGSELWPQRG